MQGPKVGQVLVGKMREMSLHVDDVDFHPTGKVALTGVKG